ncbi:TolC family protein [Clostridium sp. MT-14]|uniref:TolC family protein n=1 Tax=Clostridium sp. MT-14 TaxID=3348360 RepID=UPI0035F3C57B
MNKIKIFAAAVIIIFCTGTSVFAQGNTLDIDAAIDAAVKESYEVKSADISTQQAQNSYNQAVKNAANYGDQLDEGGDNLDRYTRLTLLQGIANPPAEAKFSIYKYSNMGKVAENQVKLSAYTQYTALMDFKDALDLEKQKFQSAKDQYNISQLKLKLGTASPADVKQAEADYYSENLNLNKAQRQYDLAVMKINQILDRDIYTKYDVLLRDKITESPYIRNYDDYVSDALKNRAEILNAQENVNLKKFEYNIIKGVFPSKYDTMNQIGQYGVNQAQDALDIAEINIPVEINSLYSDLQNKSKMLDSKKDAFNLAQRNYNVARVKYNAGVMSKVDFDVQASDLKAAQNDLKSFQRDIWMAQLKLNLACGVGDDTSKLSN